METILKETYERETLHDRWQDIYQSSGYVDRTDDNLFSKILKILKLAPRSLFLDAGCGRGHHMARICELGYRYVGVDISQNSLERASRAAAKGGLSATFVNSPLEQLPFPDDHFDCIHCRGVLMHIPDWERCLRELCRVLRPGGGLILMENNDRSVAHRLIRFGRRWRSNVSDLKRTEAGDEFWATVDGLPFLVRVANLRCFATVLEEFRVKAVLPSAFVGLGRVPRLLRPVVTAFNGVYLKFGMPWKWSQEVVLVAVKHEQRQSA